MTSLQNAQYCRIALASPEQIRAWTQRQLPTGEVVGCVTQPYTLDYQTHRPETGGLFCERIFGPTKSYACACGKYGDSLSEDEDEDEDGGAGAGGDVCQYGYGSGDGGPKFCKICGVELTESGVRRHRMGYISLECQVIHVWYFKQRPNHIARLLDQQSRHILSLVYYDLCLINPVVAKPTLMLLWSRRRVSETQLVLFGFDERGRRQSLARYLSREWFGVLQHREVVEGADAVLKLLSRLRLEMAMSACRAHWQATIARARLAKRSKHLAEEEEVRQRMRKKLQRAFNELLRRLILLKHVLQHNARPEWVALSCLPVLPPALRPIIELREGQLIASDLNHLYQIVIFRNNRLAWLKQFGAPLSALDTEKILVQRAVDALLANGMAARHFLDPDERPYKSFSDILKGKRGRFRENLLGKRVDYSGRSVIVVGPSLSLSQCGLPSEMAIELFQPFVIRRLIAIGLAPNIRAAKNMLRPSTPIILRALSIVMRRHVVILNRAPTLHRLGIQAFQPVLVRERAIHLHPLVCTGFNADFDGDQMAVHVPLSLEARAEANTFLLPYDNLLSPATGEAVVVPSQDMLLGVYVLTLARHAALALPKPRDPRQRQPRPSSGINLPMFLGARDVLTAYNQGQLHHHSRVWLHCRPNVCVLNAARREAPVELQHEPVLAIQRLSIYEHLQVLATGRHHVLSVYVRTTIGRACLNQQIEQAMAMGPTSLNSANTID